MASKSTLLIIDAHALIHRAYHALPPLTNKKGVPVGATYGFLRILISAVKEIKPTHVAVAFDSKGKTFRHDIYKEYKATRKKTDDELIQQFPIVREFVDALGYPAYAVDKYEADDLIGTICAQHDGTGTRTIILTGDMDMLQLVDTDTRVMKLHKGVKETVLYDPALVEEKHGLRPDQIIDYKALRGDSSDNIPGVRGIGEKGATQLLQEYDTAENVFEHLEEIGGRNKKPLSAENAKADAILSKELATINQEAPIEFDINDATVGKYDEERLVEMLQEYEFASLLSQIKDLPGYEQPHEKDGLFAALNKEDEGKVKSANNRKTKRTENEGANESKEDFSLENRPFDYNLVQSAEEIKELAAQLSKQTMIAFDTETTGLDPLTDELVGISFSWKAETGYYLACGQTVPKEIVAILEDPSIKKVAHNAKFDIKVLHHAGVQLAGVEYDTMIASYLLNSGSRGHSLSNLAFVEFGHQMEPIEALIGKGKNQITMAEVEPERVAWYASEDTDLTWRLYERLKQRVKAEGLDDLMRDIEMPTLHTLVGMEELGVKLDTEFLENMSKKLHKRIAEIEAEAHKMAGHEFNVASNPQLKVVLFEEMGLPTEGIKKTKTGFSTAASELEKLRGTHPIIELIEEFRELSKLTSTYLDALPKLINEETGRVHTDFNQTIAATGRLSSTNPNLQNIPIRTELGREIRKAFVPDRGQRIVALDYSQIELRVVAHLSKDKMMMEAFHNGEDIHSRTAAALNDIEIAEVTKDQRRQAKAINFGILYGMGVQGIMRDSGVSRDEARAFLDKYFEVHSGIAQYIEDTKKRAHDQGYTKTLFGRRRPLPDIASGNRMLQAAAERAAVNMPVQGTAADIMKLAMIAVHDAIQDGTVDARMILQVHDELVFEIHKDKAESEAEKIREIMESVYKLEVPLIVDAEIGTNWGELKTIE